MREDWIECELGEIITVSSGKGLTSKEMKGTDYPFYGGNGINGYHNEYLFEEEKLIIGRVGVKCGVTHITKKKSWVTDNALVVNFKIEKYSLKYFQLKLEFENLNKLSNSTAQPVISGAKIYSYHISLAPLPFQRAIVSKIEALFSDLDNGIANFKKAQAQLKIYRQAVLKKAFEGELTKEWREKIVKTDGHPSQRASQLPTAEELLKQIKQERQNHYNQQVENWKKAVKEWERNGKKGKKPTRISKPKEATDLKDSDIETYENLPNTWKWSKFGSVTYKIGDIDHKMPKIVDNGYPYLSTGNLNNDGTIDFTSAKSISKEDFDRLALKIKPEKGDIIFPRYGTVCDKVEQSINESIIKAEALRQSILKKAFEGKLLSHAEIELFKLAVDYEPASELLKKIKAEKVKTYGRASQPKTKSKK